MGDEASAVPSRAYSIGCLSLIVLMSACDTDRVHVTDEVLEHLALYGCPEVSGVYEMSEIGDLIAEPTRFDGKAIKVSGFYHHSFEHQAIYPTPVTDDFSRGVWVLDADDALKDQRVILRGVYVAGSKNEAGGWPGGGHLGQWPGSICVHSTEAAD